MGALDRALSASRWVPDTRSRTGLPDRVGGRNACDPEGSVDRAQIRKLGALQSRSAYGVARRIGRLQVWPRHRPAFIIRLPRSLQRTLPMSRKPVAGT